MGVLRLLRSLLPWKRRRAPHHASALDAALLALSPVDLWTVRDACEGVQIFGAPGSGKTSGSGRALALEFLRFGMGGLVLCAKPDEAAVWSRYAAITGRSDDLRIVTPGGPHRFNFLAYEQSRGGVGGGLTENIVSLLVTSAEALERSKGSGGNEAYFRRAQKQMLRNAVDVVMHATGAVSLPAIVEVIQSAPQSPDEVRDPEWQASSLCCRCIDLADAASLPPTARNDLEVAAQYWLVEFPALDSRTRSNIVSTFTTIADGLRRGVMHELFCTTTTIAPEDAHEGAIIVLDLPVKGYEEAGQLAQVIFKTAWQRATERRTPHESMRPVFLWMDEAQLFVTSHDPVFQATARSARACTVMLTQNISNYLAVMGGANGRAETDSLLGNLGTKIFHANGDSVTNKWAEEIFARSWQSRFSANTSSRPEAQRDHRQVSGGVSQSLDPRVLAGEFTTLRTGGPKHGFLIDAVVFQSGRRWNATNENFLKTTFSQT